MASKTIDREKVRAAKAIMPAKTFYALKKAWYDLMVKDVKVEGVIKVRVSVGAELDTKTWPPGHDVDIVSHDVEFLDDIVDDMMSDSADLSTFSKNHFLGRFEQQLRAEYTRVIDEVEKICRRMIKLMDGDEQDDMSTFKEILFYYFVEDNRASNYTACLNDLIDA